MIATLMTFTLAWGWIHFEATGAGRYEMFVWRLKVFAFAPYTWYGWLTFHVLDVAAVLVIAGCGYFLWRRFRDREVASEQRLGYDFVPLVALIAISATGLLLTFSSALLEGRGYEFLAILHMAVVVLVADLHPVREVLPRGAAPGDARRAACTSRRASPRRACSRAACAARRSRA